MNENKIEHQIFFKLFEKEYKDSLNNGELFFNHYSFFHKFNEDIGDMSKDINEGLTMYDYQPFNVFIKEHGDDKNPIINLGISESLKRYESSKLPYTHIFCFSYQEIEFNKKIDFDILDRKEFYKDKENYTIFTTYHLGLILNSLHQKGFKPVCKKVSYVDLNKIAKEERLHLDGFTKDIKYQAEQEYRIGITLPTKEPKLININQVLNVPIGNMDSQFGIMISDNPNIPF